jgi:hypothetical protein
MFKIPDLPRGRYRHYKGKDYEVLDLVRHSETEQWLVLYRTLYTHPNDPDGKKSNLLWVRPYEMFTEKVVVDGKDQLRFHFIGRV